MLDNICIPINLDAFILNKPVCDTSGPTVLIAPITQPDYVGLRLDNSVIQHDVLPPVDLHSARPALMNPRISKAYSADLKVLDLNDPEPNFAANIGGALFESRLGVYLHWSLPRGYRSGSSAAEGTVRTDPDNKSPDPPNIAAGQNPTFSLVPNRWLIVRMLKDFLPKEANAPPIDAWVVESDRLTRVEDLSGDVDLETELTPYVVYDTTAPPGNLLHSQAEKYIGFRSQSLVTNAYLDVNAAHVPLSVMNSSNPVFADYAIHNPNVFSLKDNFEYAPGKYLQQAHCDYIVVGWHSSSDDGPLGANGTTGALSQRVTNFLCNFAPTITDKNLLDSQDYTPLLSHGVIYDVLYDANVAPDTPANKYAANFNMDVAMEPIAVGVTPLDSVLTFLHAHRNDTGEETELFGSGISDTANTILEMAELLYAAGDDYDSRVKASDLIAGQSFTTSLGGSTWHYDKKKDKKGPPLPPSTVKDPVSKMSELDYLNKLNDLQHHLDITERMLAISQWELFAEFFKFCSDVNNQVGSRKSRYLDNLNKLYANPDSYVKSLQATSASLESGINAIMTPAPAGTASLIPAKKVSNDPFQQRTDPTLLIAGMDSGWPPAFLDSLQVRFDGDVSPPANLPTNPPVSTLLSGILANLNLPKLSGNIKPTINKLLLEAADSSEKSQIGFKKWTGQPFCPIFVEWEAIFYNVDFTQNPSPWAIGLGSSPMSNNNQTQVRYINPTPLSEPSSLADQDARAVSGRILVLPQPSFALAAIVKQVLDVAGVNVPESLQQEVTDPTTGTTTLNGRLDPVKTAAFIKEVEALKFISGDLMGFTDSLLTLGTGSHVKPNVRVQGKAPKALAEAIDIGKDIGLTLDVMEQIINVIDGQTAKTPFGTLVDFEGAKFQPFKGVQHGQLVLTKLVIVDKFGQAIACPTPGRKPTTPPSVPDFPIHPCLADQLCPTVIKDTTLNTVFIKPDAPSSSGMIHSPFIQITPAINQDARINASFLTKNTDASGGPPWRVCNDWDNPIFGWIIVNYADSSLQFFTGEGLFFTSIRFGGPTGTMAALPWAPFAQPPPDQATELVSQQLVDLIGQMQGNPTDDVKMKTAQEYLRAIWNMINGAIENMPFPPSQYSAYANAIVGKPLALVNVGWSLELAEAPKKAQHTLGQIPEPGYEEAMMNKYDFHVKIGDSDRPFDGVVCYWDTDDNVAGVAIGKTTFRPMYTYPFPLKDVQTPEEKALDPRVNIGPENFPVVTPYFIDPTKVDPSKGLLKSKAEKLRVKTLLIDPYTPLHLYSAILPIKSLKLPGWSLEAAMKNMTAFFTLGPILVTKDVPKTHNDKEVLKADSWLATQNTDDPTKKAEACPINLPIAGGKGMWNWLQPYVDPNPPQPGVPIRPLYNALEVGQETGSFRNDPAPYTLLEGYLQLARPLINPSQLGS